MMHLCRLPLKLDREPTFPHNPSNVHLISYEECEDKQQQQKNPNCNLNKAEHQRIDAFEPSCWRRLLRVPWTLQGRQTSPS